ncbi:MAG TPA: dipeptidase [Nannocystaceae bacterium]|nr:dipeptidase [Nannocystaceae bacterium]
MTRAIAVVALALALACRGPEAGPSVPASAAAPAPRAMVASPPEPVATSPEPAKPPTPAELAVVIAKEAIIVDGHVDLPWRLSKSRNPDGSLGEDVLVATGKGDFDLPRAVTGGLDAPFMSIFVPTSFERKGAKAEAERMIDLVEALVARAPGELALARSPADVRANTAKGLLSLPLGMENGAPIEGDLANVAHFHARGIRYITLAHSKNNHLSDSSFDTKRKHKGLSAFGKKVVAEMNRLGIIVDVSHLSDQAFRDVMAISKTPALASHSSCRHFTPGWERNMSDEMIQALAAKGGVIMINFGSDFLDGELRKRRDAQEAEIATLLKAQGLRADTPEGDAAIADYHLEHPILRATVEQVADHIDHVVALVGIDHVGLGSDFDGVGDSLPEGLRDVSQYPNLVRVLLERGRSRAEIEQILGENALRVWQAVEDHAVSAAKSP